MFKLLQNNQSQISLFLQKRRQFVLAKQKSQRQKLINQSRKVFQSNQITSQPSLIQIQNQSKSQHQSFSQQKQTQKLIQKMSSLKIKKKKKFIHSYADKFQIPEWLISIPNDFKKFLVVLRPLGKKVMIFINGRHAIVRDKKGYIFMKFETQYIGKGSNILQGIYNQKYKTFFITDLLKWKGIFFTCEQLIFRLNWINANLPRLYVFIQKQITYKFELLEIYENNRQTIQKLYVQQYKYQKQGLIFMHPESRYVHKNNENILYWKDSNTSKYFRQSSMENQEYNGIGLLTPQFELFTLDKIRIELNKDKKQQLKKENESSHIHFVYSNIFLVEQDNNEDDKKIMMDGFRVIKQDFSRKGNVDSLSKLLFQCKMNPIKINDIINALN